MIVRPPFTLVLLAILLAVGCRAASGPAQEGTTSKELVAVTAITVTVARPTSTLLALAALSDPTATAASPNVPAATTPVSALPTPTPLPSPESVSGPVRIHFPVGATSENISGSLAAGEKQTYLFRAAAGQLATVELTSTGDRASFALSGVADGLFHKATNDLARRWVDQLPLAQDYLITVAAFADTTYTLHLTIEPLPFDRPPPRPTLTTLVEAPVRTGPGPQYAAVHALPPGATVEILGRTADNAWFAISSPESQRLSHVWIAAAAVHVTGDLELLVPIYDN